MEHLFELERTLQNFGMLSEQPDRFDEQTAAKIDIPVQPPRRRVFRPCSEGTDRSFRARNESAARK